MNNADGTQRELFIPDKKNIDVPGIFSKTEYERLNKNAKVVTLEDRLRMKQDADNLRDKLEMESQKRKDVLIKAQQNLQKAAEASVRAFLMISEEKGLKITDSSFRSIMKLLKKLKCY